MLANNYFNRITRTWKFHHPSFRPIMQRFVLATIDNVFDTIQLQELITLAICDITNLQEVAMKAVMRKSEAFLEEGYQG